MFKHHYPPPWSWPLKVCSDYCDFVSLFGINLDSVIEPVIKTYLNQENTWVWPWPRPCAQWCLCLSLTSRIAFKLKVDPKFDLNPEPIVGAWTFDYGLFDQFFSNGFSSRKVRRKRFCKLNVPLNLCWGCFSLSLNYFLLVSSEPKAHRVRENFTSGS